MYCHLCGLDVPGDAHDDTLMHRAAQLIAVTALDHVRSQVFPNTKGTGVFVVGVPAPPEPTQPQAVPTTTFSFGTTDSLTKEPSPKKVASGISTASNTPVAKPLSNPITIPNFKAPVFGANLGATDFEWCDYCQKLVAARAHVTHQRLKLHIDAAYPDQEPSPKKVSSGISTASNTPVAKPLSNPITIPNFKVFGANLGATDFEWCDYCHKLVAARAHVTHQRLKFHIDAAYQDQMFMEAVRGFVDDEDLKILEGSSTDGVHLDPFIPGSKLNKVYNCGTCEAHFVPVEFKKQHRDSIRHRACLALKSSACRRLRRHLADTGDTPGARGDTPGHPGDIPGAPGDAPTPRSTDTTMRDLLYAYRYPQSRIENSALQARPHFRILPKIYINRILARLERTGAAEPNGSYTVIVTDNLVIIKMPDVMAVDWLRYLGVRACGEGHTECSACGGIFKNIEEHLETVEHVKYVLSPIDEQGVRRIDSSDSMCLLCGDKIWTFDVTAHINEDRHIKNRDFALNRGKMYADSKEDLKLHLILNTGTIKLVSGDCTGEKQESLVIHNGFDENQVTVNKTVINGGDHDNTSPSDTTNPSDIVEPTQ